VECGTHAVVAAGIAPYGHSEQVMAAQLLPAKLTPEMLVLADRNFYGFKRLADRLRYGRQAGLAGQIQPQAAGRADVARWLVPEPCSTATTCARRAGQR
jgi:hypothetical protein